MKLSEVKKALTNLEAVTFQLPDESFVPAHFHVTEVGAITKNFIDCGGTIRTETKVNFQLWEDEKDIDHKLKPGKLLDIIQLSERVLGLEDAEIEVEYQEHTIGKYDLEFNGTHFLLFNTQTDCLAKDKCGIPSQESAENAAVVNGEKVTACVPGNGCC
tara:strand:+ start:32380 stop:32856 length:477 start_codon:yes stop_codon:yes gene_type:complete